MTPPRKRRPNKSPLTSDNCRTCRIRKVKCDGARPVCNRCANTNRTCEGYAIWQVTIRTNPSLSQATKEEIRTGTTYLSSPSSSSSDEGGQEEDEQCNALSPVVQHCRPHVTETARVLFDYFLHISSVAMRDRSPVPIPTGMYQKVAVSICLNEPIFFHALVAIAGVDRAILPILSPTLETELDPGKSRKALQQYQQALTNSREFLATHKDVASDLQRVVLINQLLFVLECFRGDIFGMKQHRRLGRAIIQAHREKCADIPAGTLLSTIVSLLQVNDLQGHLYIGTTPQMLEFTTFPRQITDNYQFRSLEEANASLELLMNESKRLREGLMDNANLAFSKVLEKGIRFSIAAQHCLLRCLSRLVGIPSKINQRIDEVLSSFDRWKAAFSNQAEMHSETLAALLMRMQYCFAYLTLLACRDAQEKVIDQYTDDAIVALECADRFLTLRRTILRGATAGCASPSGLETIAFYEFGVLPALYTICLKVRSLAVRYKALNLLYSSNRRENTVESSTLAVIADTVIALEQPGARETSCALSHGETPSTVDVPEAVRYAEVVASYASGDPGALSITCGRITTQTHFKVELAEYHLRRDEHLRWRNFADDIGFDIPLSCATLCDRFEFDANDLLDYSVI